MKQLLILIVVLGIVNSGYAQTAHNTNCPSCAYSKNRVKDASKIGTSDESCGCAACKEKKNKEKAAKQAELKRRDDALAAKIKAEQEAKQKAFAAEQQRKREEAAQRKQQEEKDKLAREALMKKYRELADKGKVNIKESQSAQRGDVDLKVIPFVNDKTKMYGFKIDTLVVFEKPFTEQNCWFDHIDNSSYFSLVFGDQTFKKQRCFLVNMYGEELSINGIKEFSMISYPNNQIWLYKDNAEPEFVRNWADVDYRSNMYADKVSAITEITRPRSGYSFGCEDNYVVPCKQLVLNLSLHIEQEIDGYRIFATRAKCTN